MPKTRRKRIKHNKIKLFNMFRHRLHANLCESFLSDNEIYKYIFSTIICTTIYENIRPGTIGE